MTPIYTRTPPTIRHEKGGYVLDVVATIEGVQYRITAPLGDGRYHFEMVVDRIVAPAIAPRPTDRRRPTGNAEA